MTTPSRQKCDRAFVRDSVPPAARKTSSRVEGGSNKGHFYKPLPPRFQHNGFEYRQIAREGDAAIYEQRRTGGADPSVCYEVTRIRRRDGFQIDGRFVQPAEVYPKSNAWGVDGFTFTERDKAWDRFVDISLEEPARTGKEVN